MAYTLLMTAVLVVGFALMFALVYFAEGVITDDSPTEESTASTRRPRTPG